MTANPKTSRIVTSCARTTHGGMKGRRKPPDGINKYLGEPPISHTLSQKSRLKMPDTLLPLQQWS
jgi:hypothetical protein